MMQSIDVLVETEDQTQQLAAALAGQLKAGWVIYLIGNLGVGKTTFTRAMLRGLGFSGHVKSPTYTLVEHYSLTGFELYHFDFYRLDDPSELEYIGIREYFSAQSICVIEWPEKGAGAIQDADLNILIDIGDTSAARRFQFFGPAAANLDLSIARG